MTTNALPKAHSAVNIVPLPKSKLGRIPAATAVHRQRFRILSFTNASGTQSYRVQGMNREGKYVRQNFADLTLAQLKQAELEADYYTRKPDDAALRATKLTEAQLRLAETVFLKLDADEDLIIAVDYWKKHGRHRTAQVQAPRLDDALAQFKAWLIETPTLRELTKTNLRRRVSIFANSVGNVPVDAITPEIIERYLAGRKVAPVSRNGDKRALSRFFGWCLQRPRHWLTFNPAREIHVELGQTPTPAILSVKECAALLQAAEAHRRGRLAPYVAVCLFGGLRPTEAARLTWEEINLSDREIRLDGAQTKTGRPRVVTICNTLKAWLTAYRGREIHPTNWENDFRDVKTQAGFGPPAPEDASADEKKRCAKLKTWTPDVMRHTAISHYFRQTGSYGQAAEQFGNSENIIRKHYQARVSTADTKAFYSLRPAKKGTGE